MLSLGMPSTIKLKMKINKIINKAALISVLVFFVGVPVLVKAANLDPALNYLYGAKESDCADGDFHTIDAYSGTYCVSFSNDKNTYSFQNAPPQGACPSGSDGANGVKTQGPFGTVCVYFKTPPGVVLTKVTQPQGVTRTSDPFKETSNDPSTILKDINYIADFLAIGVGVVVTIMVVIGGIQYSAAANDPQKVASAKKKISNALFALLAFGLLWAFLQFIVPGGGI